MGSKRQLHQSQGGNKKPKNNEEVATKSSSAQKREMRKERQSHRRHAETVVEAKTLWNKLRLKSNTPEETKELMQQVMKLIRGKVNEIALQHDASRVVQAAVQFGSDAQRKELLSEIVQKENSLAELSKIQYAHFLALKFIRYCAKDRESVKIIVKVSADNMRIQCEAFETVPLTFPNHFSGIQGAHSKTSSPWCWISSCRVTICQLFTQGHGHAQARILRTPLFVVCG